MKTTKSQFAILKVAGLSLTILFVSSNGLNAKQSSLLSNQHRNLNSIPTTWNVYSDDTSTLEIQDTLAVVAPNLPDVEAYSSGIAFWGYENRKYDSASLEEVEHWIEDYPDEVKEFNRVVTKFLETTDESNLSFTQKEIYYAIKAQMLQVMHENAD